ncbi:NOL1/NOP2/sun family putative RNA methylase [Candidatus Woesearchaeota archaeon]|nr:NOL1/NOP2/sun family putative RNA methylase [Candidatus Woesearchaeota archaeon]
MGSSLPHDLTPMPKQRADLVKPGFEERYRLLLGDGGYERFMTYSFSYLRKSIRVNTLKTSVEGLQRRLEGRWGLTPVPWCPEGFWISFKGDDEQEERFDLGNLPEHPLGFFYVQDAASMIPPIVLDPQPGEVVLDLCAAPGSKTTQLAALMRNEGLVIANDIQGSRLPALGINVQRVGAKNVMVTRMPGQRFKRFGGFDRVLVDAPCSGTGTVRKSMKVLQMWSPNLVKRLVKEQRKLLATAFDSLKEGGVVVYSTCTLEPEEDEGVVSWLLEQRSDAEVLPIALDIGRSLAVTEFDGESYHDSVRECLRIYPQDNDSEGFFVARIRKKR